jgi:AAA+ superfamily predicted ATPase
MFGGSVNNERKGAVNLLMDEVKGSIIWITNSIAGIDNSTRRRFAYSLRFDGISDSQKEAIIKNTISKNKISKKFLPQMKTLSKRYGLSTAGIGLVLDKASSISENNSELAYNIEKIAKAHYELISNKKPIGKELKIDERFDPSILNIDFPVDSISKTLENYKKATENGDKIPMSFLFSGVAGTGKTQLGRYIADKLGKELILKRMSEISNCYVGETEKNIRKMFLEATRNNAVLMIDEADSLFYNRSNANRSWEISQTNELLAQMEVYSGVFICTTNLVDSMDAAAMRRFNWKVKFSAPTHEGRIKLYSKYFLENKTPSNEVEDNLYSMDGLCPGDFKAVWQKIRFLPEKPDSLILEALKSELSYKKDISTTSNKIGFC